MVGLCFASEHCSNVLRNCFQKRRDQDAGRSRRGDGATDLKQVRCHRGWLDGCLGWHRLREGVAGRKTRGRFDAGRFPPYQV